MGFRTFAVLIILVCPFARAEIEPESRPILDRLTTATNSISETTNEGLKIATSKSQGGKLETAIEFPVPLIITEVARSDTGSLRLYFGKKGLLVLNWEAHPGELRHHDPRTGEQRNVKEKGAIPRKEFVTVRWIITKSHARVEVNGVERAIFDGDFAGLSGTVGIGSMGGTSTVRSLSVTQLPADTTPESVASVPATSTGKPINIDVPSKTADTTTAATRPVDNSPAIERPEFQDKPKRLVKNVTAVTSMMVRIGEDGLATGLTSDIIATVPAVSRAGKTAGVGFVRSDGDPQMKAAFEEAVRAVTIRYPFWEPGHIDISFGEKFISHGGPSAGTAFALLMLSTLEGFDIDPKCAITGDITVDWKVRKVGGVTAKLRGATLDKCLYAAIPEGHEIAFADMAIFYSNAALWDMQVFSIANLQQAVSIARTDRPAQLAKAIKLFADLQTQFTKSEKETLGNPQTRKTLKAILELAPNHLSARQTLALCEGTAPKTLSANATIYQLTALMYPYRTLLASHKPIDRDSLPAYVTILTRKRIATLRPIAHKDLAALLVDVAAFIEAVDGLAGHTASASAVNAKAQNLDARFATLGGDPGFVERLIHEGY
jgi:hypothetical protein